MLVFNSQEKVSGLKRAIEREFMELFPVEPPYVVAKLEDANGFSLSNGSNIGDFIQNGQMVYAEPENLLDPNRQDYDLNVSRSMPVLPLHGGQNSNELITMLQSLQNNIL